MNNHIRRFPLHWTVGHHTSPDVLPLQKVPATVPGAVQLDWARSQNWPEGWEGDASRPFTWMEECYWTYSARLEVSKMSPDESLYLVCGGVDYRFQIWLNDQLLLDQEGMFTPVRLDLTGRAQTGDVLRVVLWPPPPRPAQASNRRQADYSCKPPVGYGWNFHPRLIPSGIWKETHLEIRPTFHIRQVDVQSTFDPDMVEAHLLVRTKLSLPGRGQLGITLLDPKGTPLFTDTMGFEESALSHPVLEWSKSLPFPQLWWPNGQGDQPLYTLQVRLLGQAGEELDLFERRAGLRRIRLVMHEGAWDPPSSGDLPASRRHPPITLEINGRVIFAKGSNWAPPHIFPGTIRRETYLPLLRMARNAHFNLLRCWAGGGINKSEFYDLCDELGLLVWTEFPLASLPDASDPGSDYLRVLDQESRSIIKQIRGHACHALWCGGDALFNSRSHMTDQSPAVRLLHRNCFDLDPETPFLSTSPLMGMVHGDYRFRNPQGEEVFQIYPRQAGCSTAWPAFGCPGASSMEVLRSIIPENELFPPAPGTSWEWHQAFNAWDADKDSWLMLPTLEHYFGKSSKLEELVERSQLLQSEGCKFIYEEARRQKPFLSLALSWCYNEPWPTAANNSLINWPDKPKPAYFAVAASCRPVIASARVPRFSWKPGEMFRAGLWILNDAQWEIAPGRFEAEVDLGRKVLPLGSWNHPATPAQANLEGPTVEALLPDDLPERFKLRVRMVDRPEWDSEYVFLRAR